MGKTPTWLRALGPGLIFSGAAIGTSHLVQSTRAGALYGLGLVGVIVLVNLLKYPAFRFALDYAHATRKPLLAGYRDLGAWAPLLFIVLVAPIVPIILAAVSAATGGILTAIVGPTLAIQPLSALVMVAGAALLLAGGYDWLDRVNRWLMVLLALTTFAATLVILPQVEWGTLGDVSWAGEPGAVLFIVALAGLMPTPVDASMLLSLWTLEAEDGEVRQRPLSLAQSRLAFRAPYILSAVLAVCFCIMGAGVMHSEGVSPVADAPGFAAQLVKLYREALGPGPAIIAAIAALSVMATTVIAVIDGYARMFAAYVASYSGKPEHFHSRRVYSACVASEVVVAVAILFWLFGSFALFINFVNTLSFLIGPVIAGLNHLVVTRTDMPDEARPGPLARWSNLAAIVVMAALAAAYLQLTFG